MNIVVVKWIDSSYTSGTWARKDIKDFRLKELESVGILIEEREDSYVLAGEYDAEDDQYRHLVVIPKAGIVEVIKLRKRGV